MEGPARLSVIEQNVNNITEYVAILRELYRCIRFLLENSQTNTERELKSDIISNALIKYKSFDEYLQYIGFEKINGKILFPNNKSLDTLNLVQSTISKKLFLCCGSPVYHVVPLVQEPPKGRIIQTQTWIKAKILKTKNPLLLKIQSMFNDVLQYEDPEILGMARELIPVETLQIRAIERIRNHQVEMKLGKTKNADLPFDMAMLMEFMVWFKEVFFTWVDKPNCINCGGTTVYDDNIAVYGPHGEFRMELYNCEKCGSNKTTFPRYNDVRMLLNTRCGRCGEWANCFALMCRALGYDTRYVYDVTDHVWCEVFDYENSTWIHVDPCEGKLDAPLLYSHGWNKQLSYVIALSKDDLQDVTWRYTTNFEEVRMRRNMCSESELILAIMALREHRHKQVSEWRRKYLLKRTVQELVLLCLERDPEDQERHGRISGSTEWRMQRNEIATAPRMFSLNTKGTYEFLYYPGPDKYIINLNGKELSSRNEWWSTTWKTKNIFRKVEHDWKMVYLARSEGVSKGYVSWLLQLSNKALRFQSLEIKATIKLYETGCIDWKVKFDNEQPIAIQLLNVTHIFKREFQTAIIMAELSGGVSDVAWQHAQLFRQSLDDNSAAFKIVAIVDDPQIEMSVASSSD